MNIACRSWLSTPPKLAVIAIALLATAVPVFGQEEVTVTVTGTGSTPNEALVDAQRKAVEQGAGVLIDSQSQTENFVLVMDRIYTESRGFLTNFQELGRKFEQGIHEVSIRATVSKKLLCDSIAQYEIMMKRIGRPTIMTAFRTIRKDPRGERELTSEDAIISMEKPLKEAKFRLVDKQAFDGAKQRMLAEANLKNDLDALVRLAKDEGADILIRGVAIMSEDWVNSYPGAPPKINCSWNFQFRCIRVADSNVLCVYNRNAFIRAPRGLAPDSPQAVADRMFAETAEIEGVRTGLETRALMMKEWGFDSQNRTVFNIVIEKSKFADGDMLVEWLKSQQDWVSDAYLVKYEKAGGVTRITIDSKLPKTMDVASRLSRGVAGMPIRLEVTGTDAATITCEVAGR